MAGKSVSSAAPGAQIRDSQANLQRQYGTGEKVTTPASDTVTAGRLSNGPQPPAPRMSDDMRDADNDGGYGRSTSSMPGMPGPLPRGN